MQSDHLGASDMPFMTGGRVPYRSLAGDARASSTFIIAVRLSRGRVFHDDGRSHDAAARRVANGKE